MLGKLKEWRRGDVFGCVGGGLTQGNYCMLFEKAGAKLLRIDANIKVTSENDMNPYQKDMF